MTETEHWVNQTCEWIVSSGHVRLYRDLYRDLRESLPCGVACRLIAGGLVRTRALLTPVGRHRSTCPVAVRARAIAALKRLARWAEPCGGLH